jgi:hypothetical protein
MLVPTLLSIVGSTAAASVIGRSPSITFQENIQAEAGGMHNVHIEYATPLDGELSLHYGSCDVQSSNDCHHTLGKTFVGSHDLAKRHAAHESQRPTKFVWLPPHDAPDSGCLHAFSGEDLVGRSAPVSMTRRKQRRSVAAADIMDAEGPWFDGVAYLQEKEPEESFVAATKSKTFGILGGGMSGLMTAHLLDSVGIKDWTIVEASSRIGGRVHTSYLNASAPEDYQYQEMGPMVGNNPNTNPNHAPANAIFLRDSLSALPLRTTRPSKSWITAWFSSWPTSSTSKTATTPITP